MSRPSRPSPPRGVLASAVLAPLFAALFAAAPVRAGDDAPAAAPPPAPAPAPAPGPVAVPAPAPLPDDSVVWVVTYRVRLPKPPPGAQVVEAWIPVPHPSALQRVTELTVEAAVPTTVARDGATGNRLVHARLEAPRAETEIVWRAIVERDLDRGQATGAVAPRHLQADARAPIEGLAARLAEALGVTDERVPVGARARRIFDHVLQSMVVDQSAPGWGAGDFERSVKVGRGNASDFTAKFVALARAAGIPARWTSALDATGAFHAFAHFYDGQRWVPVDPTEARRVVAEDPKRAEWFFGHVTSDTVVLSLGRDLALVPRQQGPLLNFFGGPYVEIDGVPVEVPAANRHVTLERRPRP